MPPSTGIIPKFYYFREGDIQTVMGVIAWGPRKSCKIETSWSPVSSQLRPLASLCVLMIPICTSNKLEPNELPGGSTLNAGEGRDPLPNPHQ